MTYERGEVVLVLFPDSNLRTAKRRPALVIQASESKSELAQTVVAMITSNLARSDHPSRVAILLNTPGGQQSGLITDSVVVTDNVATIHHDEIDRVIGAVRDMSSVDAALRHTFGL